MIVKLISDEPLILVNNMVSYFKHTPPDCSLFSEDNFEFPIHKELLYQTEFMQSMIKSSNFDGFYSKLTVMCQSPKEDLETIVHFLYHGETMCKNQLKASELSKSLTELFGFPQMNLGSNFETKAQSTNSTIIPCGVTTCKVLKTCICKLSRESDVSVITANTKPLRNQSLNSGSTRYDFRDVTIKEELMVSNINKTKNLALVQNAASAIDI